MYIYSCTRKIRNMFFYLQSYRINRYKFVVKKINFILYYVFTDVPDKDPVFIC